VANGKPRCTPHGVTINRSGNCRSRNTIHTLQAGQDRQLKCHSRGLKRHRPYKRKATGNYFIVA
jgi:hypothetical protein